MTNEDQEDYSSERFFKKIKIYFFILAFLIGISHTWSTRDVIYPDGISYLDVGDSYFQGDFKSAINANGYWSPLYCLILGFFNYIFKPSIDFDSIFIHLVNFFIYIISLFSFSFFLDQVLKSLEENKGYAILPKWSLISIGYGLFIWSSMNLICISTVTPDMLVSVFIYLISGLLVQIKRNESNYFSFILLGVFLGANYLCKAVMFPIAFLYIAITFFTSKSFSKTIITLISFILACSPYIYFLSKAKGHFTFSETGKLVYSFRMDKTYECWKENYPGCLGLTHQAKQIFSNPNIYEFANPINGSYPIWYDPTYWYDGLSSKFNLKNQLKVLEKTLEKCQILFFDLQGFIISCFLILFLLSKKTKFISNTLFIAIPTILIIFMYCLIDLQYRYLGAFICTTWIMLFKEIKLENNSQNLKILDSISFVLISLLLNTSIASKDMLTNGKNASGETHRKVAKALLEAGISKNDKIAVFGTDYGIYYARLAKVKIIMELPVEEFNKLYSISNEQKNNIYNEAKNYSAKIIVSEKPVDKYWINISETPYYYYKL